MAYQERNVAAPEHQTQTGEAGPQGSPPAKWLACISPHHRYLFALEHTGEVIRGAAITKLPFTHAWFCGLISVRGKLHGVIDLTGFLATHQGDMPQESTGLERPVHEASSCIVTLGAALGLPCGLVVGKLEGLRSPGDFQRVSSRPVDHSALISGIYRDPSDSQWLEVNLIDFVASAMARSISLEPELL
jgi:twitching motility protein PilI